MTREEVKMAFREAIASEYDPVLAKHENEKTAFSQEFLDKMDRLIRKNRNPLWHLVNTAAKRSLLVLTIVLVILFSVGSIPSVKAHTTDFLKRAFPTFFEFINPQDDLSKEPDFYVITDLPAGYREYVHRQSQKSSRTEYSTTEGSVLILEQWSASDPASLTYDNETGEIKDIFIQGHSAHLFKHKNFYSLSWLEDGLAVTLTVYGGITEEAFLKIAASLEKK